MNVIRNAIDGGKLIPYFQPQYNSISGKIVSAEALVRRLGPDGNIIYPDEFIPDLEKNNAVNDVDWYMLEQVCRVASENRDALKDITLAVNFSRRHISEADTAERIKKIVDSYGIDHRRIEIEITESALVDEKDSIISWIESIRAEGFKIAIDDFGSGLSSLEFVKDMPIDVIKIDRSLLSHNCENEKERVVLESIFYFTGRLKMTTVAEGVETKEQLEFLRTCGCSKIQGFYFSKPVSTETFLTLVNNNKSEDTGDILKVQSQAVAQQLLMDAVFTKYPLVIYSNLTRNSFYMMVYENFSTTSCPSTGVFDELIEHGAMTMHEEDKAEFASVFSRENLLRAHSEGKKFVKLVSRQLGDDGVYRRVETTDFFVKNPTSDDVLVITLCDNLD